MTKLKLSLVANAFDFFLEAVKHLDAAEPKKLKYATLHMASAVELILKARIAEEHWSLIFKDPAKANLEKFEKGDFRSADFQDAQDRLENICHLDLSKNKAILKTLRDMRNRIQHFAFSGKAPEISSILLKTWSFLWDFIHDEMPDKAEEELEALNDIRDRMSSHQTYVEQRLREIKSKLEALKEEGILIIDCPLCLQTALSVPGGENPECYFCRYQNEPAQVADDWATVFVGYPHTDPKERIIAPVLKECPSCGKETMIEFEDGGITPPDPARICFSCGDSGSPMTICQSCGEEFPWEDEVDMCPECRGKGNVVSK
jgi:hypothetical protein